MTLLAVYQWFELLEVRRGGTPTCAINATINCVTVWNSEFAKRLHDLVGIPVAGLGLVWGLAAVALTLSWASDVKKGAANTGSEGALKLWAIIGGLSTITFITASLKLGALCLTCLGTYGLVAIFVAAALNLVPGPFLPKAEVFGSAAARALVAGTSCFLLLLYPGSQTPKSAAETLGAGAEPSGSQARAQMDFTQYFDALPPPDARFAALARAVWQRSMTPDVSMHATRLRVGPADAKVKIIDFTDIQCGHCKQFELMAAEMMQVTPPGSFSLEAKHFPLDGECNKNIPQVSGTGVSCLGAKVQLCLETSPKFHEVRHELFDRQQKLSRELVWEIALHSGVSRDELQRCVNAPETQAKLDDDIAYALKYELSGTPLVLVNGRKTEPSPAFLLGMILSGGDVDAPLFQKLPPPPPPR